MVRIDEANVVAAMNNGGWTRTVNDEGWHFECTSSPDHRTAANKIASFRRQGSGLAYKWSAQVANFYLKTRDLNKRAPVFNSRLQNHRQNGQILQGDIDKHNQDINALQVRVDTYNRDVNRFNNELARANRLVDEINNMPPGSARDRKIREFRALESWLNGESNRLNRENNYINRENGRLSANASSLNRRIRSYEDEDRWLNTEFKALEKLHKEIPKHEADANSLLTRIERAVS